MTNDEPDKTRLQTVSIGTDYHEILERMIALTKPEPTKRSMLEHIIDEAARARGLIDDTKAAPAEPAGTC